ncbi:hypothetical protein [Pseudosulfitobacter pseudonitzschiae]|nr:hypothetical protein [Pseudosulfitobacter pseudonitzschiae]MBM1832745.1 hypothetical protein [Pseudosulfitobacter pseudonitzschiae]MBM1871516.1 hypothetical protein [Pseudosulfitobacter pseudonitzschiae]MBM1900643.1 hypothetical protein [Pseudosulfitobacter pseudonitzschiae]MBM1910261.1 hypothetical protein [Pseudosulfitobacter pseudonitzschiae]MBM1939363.1 hypothetical protein [Pseudosulfitobacter pseudonitzschiae]
MALAGCDVGGGATSAPPRQAVMANGALTLVAPEGFCIDKRSLKSSFALLARCDTLGDPDGAFGAPLGLITVSLSTAPAGAPPITAQSMEAALSDGTVLDRRETKDTVLLRVRGTAPAREGLSATYWRGTGQVGSHLVGLAMYGADDSGATGAEGGQLLDRLMQRTRAQAAAQVVAAGQTSTATE